MTADKIVEVRRKPDNVYESILQAVKLNANKKRDLIISHCLSACPQALNLENTLTLHLVQLVIYLSRARDVMLNERQECSSPHFPLSKSS